MAARVATDPQRTLTLARYAILLLSAGQLVALPQLSGAGAADLAKRLLGRPADR